MNQKIKKTIDQKYKKVIKTQNIDEIINKAQLDYTLGNYKTFKNADDLIAELKDQ